MSLETGNKQGEPRDFPSLLFGEFPAWGTGSLQSMPNNRPRLRRWSWESEVEQSTRKERTVQKENFGDVQRFLSQVLS